MDNDNGQGNGEIINQSKLPIGDDKKNSQDTGQADGIEKIVHVPYPCMPHHTFIGTNNKEGNQGD